MSPKEWNCTIIFNQIHQSSISILQINNDENNDRFIDENNPRNVSEYNNCEDLINNNILLLSNSDNENNDQDDTDVQSNISLQSERQYNDSDRSEDENISEEDENNDYNDNNGEIIDENGKEQNLIQLIREWALESGYLSMKKLDHTFT